MTPLATPLNIPHEPPRNPQFGFLYFPPYRVQGCSIAGEESFVQVPELDVCFDIGRAPKLALASNVVALSHGHMDHISGIAYYFSQRNFQGMGMGTVVCHPALVEPIKGLMEAWVGIERQRTPHRVIGLDPSAGGGVGEELELKNNVFLRGFATDHTVPSLGYVVVEKRSKLQERYVGLPQEKIVELKRAGETITYTREVPLVAYMGDLSPGDPFFREDVANVKVLITECTFMEDGHRDRAQVGKHLHITDLVSILNRTNAEQVVVTHVSRRTHIGTARKQIDRHVPAEHRDRVHLLMDSRTNRARYQRQVAEAEAAAAGGAPSRA